MTSGTDAKVTANPTGTGVTLDFVVPVGPAGPQGAQGEKGEKGDTGDTGAQGIAGETPIISVSENTPATYKVSFKTAAQEIVSPNLRSNIQAYNVDLSTTGSSVDIPLEGVILTAQNTSTSSIRLSIRAADASVPVLCDIRRTSIYGGGSVETQTNNNTSISSRITLDDIVYSNSEESHWLRIRQQNPSSKLWSLCDVSTFSSQGGARTSVWIQWIYMGVSFSKP